MQVPFSHFLVLSHFCTVSNATMYKLRKKEKVDPKRLYEYAQGQKKQSNKKTSPTHFMQAHKYHNLCLFKRMFI